MQPYLYKDTLYEAGLDECGYGCLAGPVVGSVVIWPKDLSHFTDDDKNLYSQIKDSKKLSEKKRLELFYFILEHCLDFSIQFVDNNVIDETNVLIARNIAFHRAIDDLIVTPDFLIVDGTVWDNYKNIPYKCIKNADNKFISVASASIIGKVVRDDYMKTLNDGDINNRIYDWKNNKGYGAPKHIAAIKEYGLSKYHRRTFSICNTKKGKNKSKLLI